MRRTRRYLLRIMLCAAVALAFLVTGCGSTAAVSGKETSVQGNGEQNSVEQNSVEQGDNTQAGSEQNSGAQIGAAQDSGIYVSEIQELPDYGWQLAVSFPDWKGSPDNSLAMNSVAGFESRHGQGRLYVAPSEGITSFSLYINEVPVDTSGMEAGKVYEVDYSAIAPDGMSSVQVTDILPIAAGENAAGENASGENAAGKNASEEKVSIYAAYPEVLPGTLEEAGISEDAAGLVSDIIESDIRNGFTSAQLAVIRHGRLVYENAWGSLNSYYQDGTPIPEGERTPVTTDTLYDLASVTKMFGVNYALQKLVTDGEISLDARVADYLGEKFYEDTIRIEYTEGEDSDPEVQKEWKAELTLRDLLKHQGGFPPDPRYFNPWLNTEKQEYDPTWSIPNKLFAGNGGDEETRRETVAAICRTPLMYEPGTKTMYSDVDYMLLGIVIEQVTGTDLDTYLKETFLQPMGLTHITYNPLENGFSAEDCAATELNGNTRDGAVSFPGVRTETVQGTVHDEKAYYSMGGISGHAGLFGNAEDLAKLASVMLTGGYGGNRYFSRNVMDTFMAPKKEDAANWGLGWWREGDFQRSWYFGTQSPSDTIGHQGWTGTLIMIDPGRDLVIAYLTNKINSPVTDKVKDPNKFNGNWYTASSLGFVAQILGVGMDSGRDVSAQLRSLLFSMTEDALKLIPEGAAGGHPSVRSAESLLSLYRSMGEGAGDGRCAEQADILEEKLDSIIGTGE